MDDLQFWEEECLGGSIDRNPLPPPPRSFFESDLFCNEDIAGDIDPAASGTQFVFPSNDTFNEPLSTGLQFPQSLANSPVPPPIPFAMSPTRLLTSSPQQQRPPSWRSFLDENCPLRRRVKVTITSSARVKRPSTASTSPQLSKKRRLSSRQPQLSSQNSSRYTQTKLRLPRAGEGPARITLHVPFDTSRHKSSTVPQMSFSYKPLTKSNPTTPTNNDLLTDPDTLTNLNIPPAATNLDSLIDDATDMQLPPINLESNSDLDDDEFLQSLHVAAISPAPNTDAGEDELRFDEFDVTSHLSDLDDARHQNPPQVPAQIHGVPARLRRRGKPRPCVSAEAMRRLRALNDTSGNAARQRKEASSALPLVDVAVQAVARAAQKYAALLNKVGSSPPAVTVAGALCVAQNGGKEKKGSKGAAAKTGGRRKKVRRKRTLLSFDDQEVAPIEESGAEKKGGARREGDEYGSGDEGGLKGESPLTRYLNSPLTSRIERLTR